MKRTINELENENNELKRQILILGEICRRCYMHSDFTNITDINFKSNICKRCDITFCKYNESINKKGNKKEEHSSCTLEDARQLYFKEQLEFQKKQEEKLKEAGLLW